MANRILRDWTCSETVNELSESAEIFFTRLIMKADDFGRFYGSSKLLKAQLFPLKEYTFKQVEKWRDECVKSGILKMYIHDEKEFLEIVEFNQRLRLMKSKFPEPTTYCGQMTVNCQSSDGLKRNEYELETETENEVETESEVSNESKCVLFDSWWNLYNKKTGKEKAQAKWLKLSIEEINKCLDVVSDYVKSTPDKQFRKDPTTYLNGKHWNDEIIFKINNNGQSNFSNQPKQIESFAESSQRQTAERIAKLMGQG
jgi:hypothetical protein